MELVANGTVHTSFVSVHHVVVQNHFVENLTPSARIVTIFHLTAQLQNEPSRRAGAASAPRRASYTCDRPPTTRRLSYLRSRRSLPVAFLVVRAWPRSARLSGSLSSLSFFLCDRASAGAVSPVSSSGPGVHDVEHRWLGLPRSPPVPLHWPFTAACNDTRACCSSGSSRIEVHHRAESSSGSSSLTT